MVNECEERTEIAFFDVETTIPIRPGQGFAMLEFGSILVCPKKLVEIESYSTLICPNDLSLISSLSVRCNGITKDAVVSAPPFSLVADKVFDILHGRIWAGHNILRFDCARIREAFAAINRPAPEPRGTVDSLALLTQRFGRRAGDMKICLTERVYYFVGHVNSIESTHEMATLATYFGLGQQTHRSLDDVRMNLEVLKYCATVLFLESSLPDIFTEKSWVSPNATTRSRSNFKFSPESIALNSSTSTSKVNLQHPNLLPTNHSTEENHPILAFVTPNTEPITPQQDPFDMAPLNAEVDPLPSDDSMDEESGSGSPETSAAAKPEGPSGCGDFLEPEEVSISSISVSLAPFYRGLRRIQILHNDNVLQLCCIKLKVRFNVSTKFADIAGRPRLNFVVDAIPSVCVVLDKCDSLAQRLSVESGSSSEWRPVVTRKAGYFNSPTIRLHIPTVADGNMMRWVTEIYTKEASSTTPQTLVFSRYEVAELEALFTPGTFVDAYVSLDPYDYQQNAGIRLVAKKLIVHSN